MTPTRPLAAVVSLLAAGCAIGPSPEVTAPAVAAVRSEGPTAPPVRSFFDSLSAARQVDRRDTTVPARTEAEPLVIDSAGDLRWLDVLRDPQVVALVDTALANNRDLRTAVARVQEYRAQYGVLRADLFPRLDLNAGLSTNQVAIGAFPPTSYDAVRATADVQWELDFWGRLRRQAQAGRYDWYAREEDRRATVLTLVSDVATAYLELREVDQNLRIAEQTLASREATLRLARQRFAQGVISELDVRQFESEVATPASSVAQFTRQRAQKEHQLSVLLGRQPGPIGRGAPLEETVRAVRVPDSLSADLVLRRPDVRRAERELSAATARVGIAAGNRLPRLLITGSYGTQRPDFDGLFRQSGEVYTLQGGVSIPIFTGGRLINEERAAHARVEQSRAQYEQTVLVALGEASDALVGVRTSRDQLVAQETQARALRRALSIAERRYETGVSSYLEVLDAQRGLFSAELAYVQVQRQYLAATVQLYRALGGGWETETGEN